MYYSTRFHLITKVNEKYFSKIDHKEIPLILDDKNINYDDEIEELKQLFNEIILKLQEDKEHNIKTNSINLKVEFQNKNI
jgi:hypothetical protein